MAPCSSIRRFSVQRPSLEDLVEKGSITAESTKVFKAIAVGKLNVLIYRRDRRRENHPAQHPLGLHSPTERIITIEDSAELQLQQEHVCRLETRPANIEGKGEVTQRELVKNCLRMRPDRVIVAWSGALRSLTCSGHEYRA